MGAVCSNISAWDMEDLDDGPLLAGRWTSARGITHVMKHDCVQWHSGDCTKLKRRKKDVGDGSRRTEYATELNGTLYTAYLDENELLLWSDGDVWTRDLDPLQTGTYIAVTGILENMGIPLRTLDQVEGGLTATTTGMLGFTPPISPTAFVSSVASSMADAKPTVYVGSVGSVWNNRGNDDEDEADILAVLAAERTCISCEGLGESEADARAAMKPKTRLRSLPQPLLRGSRRGSSASRASSVDSSCSTATDSSVPPRALGWSPGSISSGSLAAARLRLSPHCSGSPPEPRLRGRGSSTPRGTPRGSLTPRLSSTPRLRRGSGDSGVVQATPPFATVSPQGAPLHRRGQPRLSQATPPLCLERELSMEREWSMEVVESPRGTPLLRRGLPELSQVTPSVPPLHLERELSREASNMTMQRELSRPVSILSLPQEPPTCVVPLNHRTTPKPKRKVAPYPSHLSSQFSVGVY